MVPLHSSGIRPADVAYRAAITEIADLSGLFPPEDVADIQETSAAYFDDDPTGDRWVVHDNTGTTVTAVAYYGPERMTDDTFNLYLGPLRKRHRSPSRSTDPTT